MLSVTGGLIRDQQREPAAKSYTESWRPKENACGKTLGAILYYPFML